MHYVFTEFLISHATPENFSDVFQGAKIIKFKKSDCIFILFSLVFIFFTEKWTEILISSSQSCYAK